MAIIGFNDPLRFIGMKVRQLKCTGECVGIEPFIKKNGDQIFLLLWRCKSLKTGIEWDQKTGPNFKGLKNHDMDKNPRLVELGKSQIERLRSLRG